MPKDFASYLLAIIIINLLMYFLFYIIMKVIILEDVILLITMTITCKNAQLAFCIVKLPTLTNRGVGLHDLKHSSDLEPSRHWEVCIKQLTGVCYEYHKTLLKIMFPSSVVDRPRHAVCEMGNLLWLMFATRMKSRVNIAWLCSNVIVFIATFSPVFVPTLLFGK